MAKRKQFTDLYGRQFEVVSGDNIPRCQYTDIWHAYERPSVWKENIWESWVKWFNEVLDDNNNGDIYITSKNCNFFTVGGWIETQYGDIWAFYITHTRQELWPVNFSIK